MKDEGSQYTSADVIKIVTRWRVDMSLSVDLNCNRAGTVGNVANEAASKRRVTRPCGRIRVDMTRPVPTSARATVSKLACVKSDIDVSLSCRMRWAAEQR